MAFSDRELLARLIQCEAGGEGDAGMRGVAGVIMPTTSALLHNTSTLAIGLKSMGNLNI